METEPRGIYTGAIGWFDPASVESAALAYPGDFCLSVPIRTLQLQAAAADCTVRRGRMGVGAGIVHDSVAAEEFAECRLKAGFLTGLAAPFELFETLLASRADGCRHQGRHLLRLRQSATYFGFVFDELPIARALSAACAGLPPDVDCRLRLALDAGGAVRINSEVLSPLVALPTVLLAETTTRSSELFLQHKTTLRAEYDQAWKRAIELGAFDMLFFNEHGHLTEGGRSNVLLKKDGHWLTPPLSDGVLPGVMRAVLLADPRYQLREQSLTREDLLTAEQLMLCNALRGPFTVQLQLTQS